MSDDLAHDPHLRAALRHAPDHALVPPAGVSQTILNAARQVHKPARAAATPAPAVRITVAPPRVIAWLRQWFASPRVAGGLATGLVAALGLGLWFDLDREPAIDRPTEYSTHKTRSSDAAPPAPAAEPSAAAGVDERLQMQRAPQVLPAPAETLRAKRPSRAPEETMRRGAQEPAPQAPPAPVERREDSAAHEAERPLAKSAPQAAAPPPAAPTAEPAPAIAEPRAAPQRAEQTATDALQREAASKSDLRMSLAAGRAAATAGARASAAEVGAMADATAAASPASALLRRARSESAAHSARWSWMPPGSPVVGPFDDAGQAWLARVVQATTRARWSDVTERAGAGDAIEVRWWRDDWPQATLRIEADGLRWIEHGGRIRHAPLDAAALQRLRGL